MTDVTMDHLSLGIMLVHLSNLWTLLKLLDGMKYYLAGTLNWPKVTGAFNPYIYYYIRSIVTEVKSTCRNQSMPYTIVPSLA